MLRLERYARLLDAQFRVPGTRFRFGLDPIIGLLPGIGDALGLLFSLYVVVEAVRLDVPKTLLFRMLRNIGLEFLVGLVPVLGDLFDAGFKANLRNTGLLRAHIESVLTPEPLPRSRHWLEWVVLVAFAGLALWLLVVVARQLVRLFS